MATGMQKKAARKRAALIGTKVYSVTVEVKVVIHAVSREDAVLNAMNTVRVIDNLESLKVTEVFCPAEGK